MVLIAAFMSQVGGLQTAPILIAVVTAYLAVEGVKYVVGTAARRQAHAAAGQRPAREFTRFRSLGTHLMPVPTFGSTGRCLTPRPFLR